MQVDFEIIEKMRSLGIDPLYSFKLVQNNRHNNITAMFIKIVIIYFLQKRENPKFKRKDLVIFFLKRIVFSLESFLIHKNSKELKKANQTIEFDYDKIFVRQMY